ncbi:thioesterase family protein [Desulfosarcina ovata]|nr:thioesterase family protein [Desulfosarcina ovata]
MRKKTRLEYDGKIQERGVNGLTSLHAGNTWKCATCPNMPENIRSMGLLADRPRHEKRDDFKSGEIMHNTEIRIRGYHLDLFGHVNNARYLEFLEEARWAIFDDKLNLEDLARGGFAFTVVSLPYTFKKLITI